MSDKAAAVMTLAALRAHDAVRSRLRDQGGQGTVEYVGLMLLVAGVLAAVVAWAASQKGDQGIGKKVSSQITKAIDITSSKSAGGH